MTSWKKPTNKMITKVLKAAEKVTERRYFFSRLENPLWFKPLVERGCFKYPPKAQRFGDGTIQFPYWPEIQYLRNVCRALPDEVVNLVMNFPKIDNPAVYDGILDIALQLSGKHSIKLKDKIFEYMSMEHQWQRHRYTDLLGHWTEENETSTALELSKMLVAFAPDSQSAKKQKLQKEDPMSFGTLLRPAPQMEPWIYREIMSKGVCLLAEKEPYQVARLLIDTTANMIRLRTHQEDLDKEADLSESWCPRLQEKDGNYGLPERILVDTLTFACEKVFEKSSKTMADLNTTLRNQRCKIFKRLRHHLYAQYPNEQTKPWIRETILTHKTYNLWEHPYEFQQVIRRSCEHFKETLLSEAERTRIFDTILEGPSKENYRHWIVGWLGEEFTEERFQERQQRFHCMQLRPFESVLFGKYETRFKKLQNKINKPISDEDYPPYKNKVRSVEVSELSPPRTSEDLSKLTDEELLTFINEWEKSDEHLESNSFVRIDIELLAYAFQTVFKESIISDPNRLKFWMDNRTRIERPIYVRMMICAMQAHVRAKNFDKLKEWFTFCEWVLSHLDREHGTDHREGDECRGSRNWTHARRAVGDFIGVCLEKDVDVPITVREQLAKLLGTLCTQYDWNLDENKPKIINDPLTEGINNTRSRALEDLVKFGFWLWDHEPQCEVLEVTTILEKRFAEKNDYPLTLPEYAILGKNYLSFYSLNETWATEHKSDFFPQRKLPEWGAAFSSFVLCNDAVKQIFKILEEDFTCALQHLNHIKKRERGGHEPIDVFGERLFNYYLWEMFPLKGQESLLERFYQQTDKKREHWANLFNEIGRRLRNTGKYLNPSMKDNVKRFFEWRLKQKEAAELQHFTFWLEAECLDAKWRLAAYAKVLDVCEVEDWEINLRTLCEMLPDHTAQVIECFFKLTESSKKDNFYVPTKEAKTILKAGRESSDESICRMSELARDNLLREGRFDFLELDD